LSPAPKLAPSSANRELSLRQRLILLPTAIVLLLILLAMAVLTHQARQRVEAERDSAGELADHLLRQHLAHFTPPSLDSVTGSQNMAELIQALPTPRHVRLFVLPDQADALSAFRAQAKAGQSGGPPGWFLRLLRPRPWEKLYPIMAAGQSYGSVLILADPVEEIAELWDEMRLIAGLLLTLTLVFIGLVVWVVARALHPVALLGTGLERLGQGDFAVSLPPFRVAELRPLGEKFNSLAQALRRMSRDNEFLIAKQISLQESERNDLAHELHDELGPSLFGIRAQAACILRRLPGEGPEQEHSQTILTLTDDLQRLNRRILSRLRPTSLELGLGAALAQLIEDWRSRAPATTWRLRFSDFETPPDEALALTLYRIVQEALTNAARHSQASAVEVEMESGPAESFKSSGLLWNRDPAAPLVHLAVRDNGRGRDEDCPPGFGLLGIHHRVQAGGGLIGWSSLQPDDAHPGTALEILLPLSAPLKRD